MAGSSGRVNMTDLVDMPAVWPGSEAEREDNIRSHQWDPESGRCWNCDASPLGWMKDWPCGTSVRRVQEPLLWGVARRGLQPYIFGPERDHMERILAANLRAGGDYVLVGPFTETERRQMTGTSVYQSGESWGGQ
jgi:hypothetical protein